MPISAIKKIKSCMLLKWVFDEINSRIQMDINI